MISCFSTLTFPFCLLSCRASPQPLSSIFSSTSSCLFSLSSHRTLTAESSESSRHIHLLLCCSPRKSPRCKKSMLVTGGLLELKLTSLGRTWRKLDWLDLSPLGALCAKASLFKVLWTFKYYPPHYQCWYLMFCRLFAAECAAETRGKYISKSK